MNDVIDIESCIYEYLYVRLVNAVPGISVYSIVPRVPAKLPCVSIEQIDDYVISSRSTAQSINNASRITFEINVFSNLKDSAKTQCKEIMNSISIWLADIGFTRIMNQPAPNLADATISRRVARFTADVIQTKEIIGNQIDYDYYIYQ